MKIKDISFLSVLFLGILGVVSWEPLAKAEDVDDKVLQLQQKMTRELHLTDDQYRLIMPIVREYVIKTRNTWQEVQAQAIVDHEALASNLRAIRENEYRKLAKVLTPDQLRTWIEKEKIRQTLNQGGGMESSEENDVIFGPNGANMRF